MRSSDSRSKFLQRIEESEGKQTNFPSCFIAHRGLIRETQRRRLGRNHRFKPVPQAIMVLPSIFNNVKLPVA